MTRRLIEIATIVAITLFIAIPTWPAPLKKQADKPLPPATPKQRTESINNLKQIGLAMHNFHDVNGHLPTNSMGKDGKPALSWRVFILPYVEEEKLYKEFHLDEPWDSKHNTKLADRMPKILSPARGKAEKYQTFYQMFSGKSCLLQDDGVGVPFTKITDGLSNTFMVAEAGRPVIWSKPDDMPFDGKVVPKLGGMFDGMAHVLMGDGSVRRIPKNADPDVLRRAIDRDDGQIIDLTTIEEAKEKE